MQHTGHGGVLQVGRAAAAAACLTCLLRTCLLRAVPGTALVCQHPGEELLQCWQHRNHQAFSWTCARACCDVQGDH